MGRYQGLTDAFIERLDAATAKPASDTFVHVPSPAEHPRFEICAVLEAFRDGRPYERLPVGHPVELLQPPPPPAEPLDLASPGARLTRTLKDLRKPMAAEPEPIEFDAIRRETIRAIEAEQREAERKQRQRLRRQRRAEQRRLAVA
jgi:hypothetical protein